MKKNIFSFLIILFIFGFNVAAQDIELPDISTTIGNDSVSVDLGDLPDFKNRVTEFDGSGNLTYAAAGQSMGGTSTFDGETINVTFENGYEMAFTYDADNDALMQSNESAGVTVVYYRA